MASLFSKIIAGEIPCYKIAENEHCFAFLDVKPIVLGHTLVVPKIEMDYIFDLNDALYVELFQYAKYISRAIKSAIPCIKVGLSVIGLEVPHAHVHLVPLNHIGDLNFSNARLILSPEEMEEVAKRIRHYL